MAAPVTHIVLADKAYHRYFADKNYAEFVVGTSFPDIRYLKVIEREKTHFTDDLAIDRLQSLSSFECGLRFHLLVDQKHEQLANEMGIYARFVPSPFITQAVKFFEDSLLYEKLSNWQNIGHSFDHVLADEVEYGIRQEDIAHWHAVLKSYISSKPDGTSIKEFVKGIRRPDEMGMAIERLWEGMVHDQEMKHFVQKFYSLFE